MTGNNLPLVHPTTDNDGPLVVRGIVKRKSMVVVVAKAERDTGLSLRSPLNLGESHPWQTQNEN